MDRIVKQQRKDKEKIYSLSWPEVSCIAKGKVGKKYEFGSKVSVATLPGSNVVVGIENFSGNPHDSKTLPIALNGIEITPFTGPFLVRESYGFNQLLTTASPALASPVACAIHSAGVR